jgi:ABC-type nitrate/sulfonate/bicarbonate transport system substrate-binding protein
MRRLGNAFDAFDGVGIVFAVQNAWAKAHAEALVGFLRAAAKAQKFLYDRNNKDRAVEILVKYARSAVQSGIMFLRLSTLETRSIFSAISAQRASSIPSVQPAMCGVIRTLSSS